MSGFFSPVLGQDEAVSRLNREFVSGRQSHAYILEGARGTGKVTLARWLAGRFFCLNVGPDGAVCGVCRHCRLLSGGNHPDYLELPREPAELRIARFVPRDGPAGEAVEHEPLLSFLRLRPVEGGGRVAVVPDAERLRPEAANAFLKTLEEPPGAALIILTVNVRERLPATIVSRCRRLGVRPLPAAAIAGELVRIGAAAATDAADLAAAAEGSLGLALDLAHGDALALWKWLGAGALSAPGAAAARELASAWAGYGSGGADNAGKRKSALAALDLTALFLRRQLRAGLPPEKTEAALAALWTAAGQVGLNVRPDVALTAAAFGVMAALR